MSTSEDIAEQLHHYACQPWAARYEHDVWIVAAANEITRLRDALAAAERVRGDGWQTTDTAPEDDPLLLLWDGKEMFFAHLSEELATHWRPLPPPPKEGT